MARKIPDARLQNRTARLALPKQQEPHWRSITEGRHVGYYKGPRGGSWVARFRPPAGGAYRKTTLGKADDTEDADGVTVLDYAQALDKARAWFDECLKPTIEAARPYTVKQACEEYVAFLRAERKTGDDTDRRLKRQVISVLGDKPVGALSQSEIDQWKRGMIRRDPNDPDAERRSKDTANRVLSMLKAALNRAYAPEKERRERGIASADAWREVKPFRDVGRSRQVHLDPQQSRRLINSCRGKFRDLVTASLLTGARPPGELAHLRVKHFRPDLRILSIIDGKTGPRDVVLTMEAVRWFEGITAGRDPDTVLLPKDDGAAWGQNHHLRPMRKAVRRAKLPKDTTLYSCRHTYASQSILAGMNLKLLAENMGTSIRMLEQHYGKFIAGSRRKLIEESGFKLGLRASNVTPFSQRKRA